MNNNPYTPPQSNVDTREFKRGKWYFAVLAGFLVDIGGTILASILISILVTVYFMSNGMSTEEIRAMLVNAGLNSPAHIFSIIVGTLFSVLGGYVCARIANHNEYRYAIIIGVLDLILGLMMRSEDIFTLRYFALIGLSFAALLSGAYLHVTLRQRAVKTQS